MRKLELYIEEIIENIKDIEIFTKGISKDKFVDEKIIKKAVINSFENIGEAVRQLPKEFTTKHSEIEWKEMVGFRDILVHTYFGIDFERVWDVIQNDLPKLKEQIIKIKEDIKDEK